MCDSFVTRNCPSTLSGDIPPIERKLGRAGARGGVGACKIFFLRFLREVFFLNRPQREETTTLKATPVRVIECGDWNRFPLLSDDYL
jgi:hypothetical protein